MTASNSFLVETNLTFDRPSNFRKASAVLRPIWRIRWPINESKSTRTSVFSTAWSRDRSHSQKHSASEARIRISSLAREWRYQASIPRLTSLLKAHFSCDWNISSSQNISSNAKSFSDFLSSFLGRGTLGGSWSMRLFNLSTRLYARFDRFSTPVRSLPDFACPKVISIGKTYVPITDELCSWSNSHFRWAQTFQSSYLTIPSCRKAYFSFHSLKCWVCSPSVVIHLSIVWFARASKSSKRASRTLGVDLELIRPSVLAAKNSRSLFHELGADGIPL